MKMFRKIQASEDVYKETEMRFKSELNQYMEYSEGLSRGIVRTGKASSYRRYLIRCIIHLKEIYGIEIDRLFTSHFLNKIEKLKRHANFKEFNASENHYYSATINEFKKFLNEYIQKESQLDDSINMKIQLLDIKVKESDLVSGPVKRTTKEIIQGIRTYPRNLKELVKAKENSDWKCEINLEHKTFINERLNKPYVEGHHLIPMHAQDYYDYTIDFADNIVTLCPNCHRQIHYGLSRDRKEMVETLYKKRRLLYPKYEIDIYIDELLSYYNI